MAERDAQLSDDPRLKTCAGTCGRITRTSKMTLVRFPGTVTRIKDGRCQACKRAHEAPPGEIPHPNARESRTPRGQRWTEEGVRRAEAANEEFLRQRQARLARQQRALVNRIKHTRGVSA